jgi:hypothetical protein
MFRFERGEFKLDGCALLSPRYCAISITPAVRDREYLETALGAGFETYFPLAYDTKILVAGQRFAVQGVIKLP